MNIYFPDKFAKDKGPPREYFFNILNTIYPEYLQKIMGHASKERMAADGSNNLIDSIKISKYWEEELRAMPYLLRK